MDQSIGDMETLGPQGDGPKGYTLSPGDVLGHYRIIRRPRPNGNMHAGQGRQRHFTTATHWMRLWRTSTETIPMEAGRKECTDKRR